MGGEGGGPSSTTSPEAVPHSPSPSAESECLHALPEFPVSLPPCWAEPQPLSTCSSPACWIPTCCAGRELGGRGRGSWVSRTKSRGHLRKGSRFHRGARGPPGPAALPLSRSLGPCLAPRTCTFVRGCGAGGPATRRRTRCSGALFPCSSVV